MSLKASARLPRFIAQYWPDYDHELSTTEPKPKTFRQYVLAGRKLADISGESFQVTEKIAEGVLRLVALMNPLIELPARKRKHRQVLGLLRDLPEIMSVYLQLVTTLGIKGDTPSKEVWNETWCPILKVVSEKIAGNVADGSGINAYLEWESSLPVCSTTGKTINEANRFRYPIENPKVHIRFGSIHSVKGETHTATLVLETFYRAHHLKTLKPWILGSRSGKGREGVVNLSRLKQHYVAMTRPSHLLCLAIREDAFTTEEITQLRGSTWRVARVNTAGPQWLPYGSGVTLLFYGPPGTGKTATAEAIAHELGMPLLVADYAKIQNCWVGQTEKNISSTFRKARKHRAVLFWDEADAMFFDRDSASRAWEVRDVNVLLQEIERFEGVCILATNRKATLDKALERRITAKIEFPRPDRLLRESIWKRLLPSGMPLAKDVDITELARKDLSGGEIKNVILNAARAACGRSRKVVVPWVTSDVPSIRRRKVVGPRQPESRLVF